ncbi:MAG: hypothetical protein DRO88_11005 [Promethearchaeia archaeon]|nr:MAG: hypothetical protein DRO88_11005 [Candidatus Lokiarchaeia archaeon]
MSEEVLLQIPYQVYQTMMKFAKSSPHREVIGPLFGKMENNNTLRITSAYPFRIGSKRDVHFEDSDYERLLPLIKEHEEKKEDWVGWFHSHPFEHGDFLYMSKTDVKYHSIAQVGNHKWTAVILNPYQIEDPRTTKGMRAFRLLNPSTTKKRGANKIKEVIINLIDDNL